MIGGRVIDSVGLQAWGLRLPGLSGVDPVGCG
jgi:hypothetical protein